MKKEPAGILRGSKPKQKGRRFLQAAPVAVENRLFLFLPVPQFKVGVIFTAPVATALASASSRVLPPKESCDSPIPAWSYVWQIQSFGPSCFVMNVSPGLPRRPIALQSFTAYPFVRRPRAYFTVRVRCAPTCAGPPFFVGAHSRIARRTDRL